MRKNSQSESKTHGFYITPPLLFFLFQLCQFTRILHEANQLI